MHIIYLYLILNFWLVPYALPQPHTTYYVNHWVHLELQDSPCVIMDQSSMGSLSEVPFLKETNCTSFINHQLPVLYYALCPGYYCKGFRCASQMLSVHVWNSPIISADYYFSADVQYLWFLYSSCCIFHNNLESWMNGCDIDAEGIIF